MPWADRPLNRVAHATERGLGAPIPTPGKMLAPQTRADRPLNVPWWLTPPLRALWPLLSTGVKLTGTGRPTNTQPVHRRLATSKIAWVSLVPVRRRLAAWSVGLGPKGIAPQFHRRPGSQRRPCRHAVQAAHCICACRPLSAARRQRSKVIDRALGAVWALRAVRAHSTQMRSRQHTCVASAMQEVGACRSCHVHVSAAHGGRDAR